jgi:hypothetical protein
MNEPPCGWSSGLPEFSSTPPRVIRVRLLEFVKDASEEQVRTWDRTIPWLQVESNELMTADAAAGSYTAILEYRLPLELRRPDLIILENGAVVVIELKGKDNPSTADIDQVAAYARDLKNYHRECRGVQVKAVLIPERAVALDEMRDDVRVVSKESLDRVLREYASREGPPAPTPEAFLDPAAYSPLPTLVHAARLLFTRKNFPAIHRAAAATQPALDLLSGLAEEAHQREERHLVLLTGNPGTGKTLVGLRLVHQPFLDGLAVSRAGGKPSSPGIYLSGNGPLVQVLQYDLKKQGGDGKVFVRGVKEYRETYSRREDLVPPEHVLVFDEAQRAFDAGYIQYRHERSKDRHKTPAPVGSEPDQFIRFAERIPRWCTVVALIGSGQEIFTGEDGGIGQWRVAVEKASQPERWTIHAPPELRDQIGDSPARIVYHRELNLNTELRFRAATEAHLFVNGLLSGHPPEKLRSIAERMHRERVRFYLTDSLEVASRYAVDRFDSHPEARYGLIASSKDKILPRYGVQNGFQSTRFNLGPWFVDPKDSPKSCCRLEDVATEFGVQGLELDLSILCWGSDYIRAGGSWSIERSGSYKYPVADAVAIRRNVYRVLLTRGREGTVVFLPPDPLLAETREHLVSCGFRTLT